MGLFEDYYLYKDKETGKLVRSKEWLSTDSEVDEDADEYEMICHMSHLKKLSSVPDITPKNYKKF